jgi:hypothetical protein
MIQRRSKKEAGAVWCISCREAWLLSPYLANRSPSSSRTGPNSSTCSKAALASTLALVPPSFLSEFSSSRHANHRINA